MPKVMTIIGRGEGPAPSASTAEAAAAEFFTNRQLMGDFAARPPIQRWRPEDRKRFLAELDRLEKVNRSDAESASAQAARRSNDELDRRLQKTS